jgi:hypothetical protein
MRASITLAVGTIVVALAAVGCPGVPRTVQGGPPVLAGGPGATSTCKPILLQAGVEVDGYVSDRYSWYDGACRPRSAVLVRNDRTDPGGTSGGFLRRYAYESGGVTRTCDGGAPGVDWYGWGYVVSHYGSDGDAATSRRRRGTWRTVLAGRHHAIHEFKVRVFPGGPVDVTVQWMFATGRPNPVLAITHDASAAGPDAVSADARAPYGHLNFDGDGSGMGPVGGLGWGDRYRFVTTGTGPGGGVDFQSPWDYSQPNLVPHVLMWSRDTDAEMGAVQTQTFDEHVGGGDYGGGALANCWGATSATKPAECGLLSTDWLWPFQLNQYEIPFSNWSKRLAWGLSGGSVGRASVTAFGRTYTGYPFQSYSVHVVLGRHSDRPTEAQVAEVAAQRRAAFSASVGAVPSRGPAGVGRSDEAPYAPAGLDPVWGAWTVRAAGHGATVRLAPAPGAPLVNPLLRVLDWAGAAPPAQVLLGGVGLVPDVDYYASVDPAEKALWITLGRTVTAAVELTLR